MALPAFLDPIITAPAWQRLLVGVIALAALGGAGYFLAISPLETRVATLRAQRHSQQQAIAETRAMVADLERLRRRAAEVERQLEIVKDLLPTEREIPSLYRTLSDAATQAGLAVTLFQPREARIRDFYNEIPIVLVGEGGYHEVGDFVGRVAALPRTTTIGELKLTGAETLRPAATTVAAKKPHHTLRAELTLLTYVYRPVGSPPAPKPAAAAARPEAAKP